MNLSSVAPSSASAATPDLRRPPRIDGPPVWGGQPLASAANDARPPLPAFEASSTSSAPRRRGDAPRPLSAPGLSRTPTTSMRTQEEQRLSLGAATLNGLVVKAFLGIDPLEMQRTNVDPRAVVTTLVAALRQAEVRLSAIDVPARPPFQPHAQAAGVRATSMSLQDALDHLLLTDLDRVAFAEAATTLLSSQIDHAFDTAPRHSAGLQWDAAWKLPKTTATPTTSRSEVWPRFPARWVDRGEHDADAPRSKRVRSDSGGSSPSPTGSPPVSPRRATEISSVSVTVLDPRTPGPAGSSVARSPSVARPILPKPMMCNPAPLAPATTADVSVLAQGARTRQCLTDAMRIKLLEYGLDVPSDFQFTIPWFPTDKFEQRIREKNTLDLLRYRIASGEGAPSDTQVSKGIKNLNLQFPTAPFIVTWAFERASDKRTAASVRHRP